jgi:hypothetical protein
MGVVGSLALLVAIFFQAGYFGVIGADFVSILSPTDYIKSLLFWFPITLICGILYVFVFYDLDSEGGGELDRERAFHKLSRFGLLDLAFIGYFAHNPHVLVALAVPLLTVAFRISYSALTRVGASDDVSRLTRNCLVAVGLPVLIFSYGVSRGFSDTHIPSNAYILTANNDNRLVNVLRIVDKGVLYQIPGSSINFTPWDEVKQLRRPFPPQTRFNLFQYVRQAFTRGEALFP